MATQLLVPVLAIVNGEFYNFEEIRENLIKEGHTFSTQSDSEILIHLYEKYNIECLNYLHGEFAFSLYDKNKKKMEYENLQIQSFLEQKQQEIITTQQEKEDSIKDIEQEILKLETIKKELQTLTTQNLYR